MKNTLETRLGIFFALALVAAALLLEMVGGLEFLRGGYSLKARFGTIQELKSGDPVKMAGVPIGRVDKIELDQDKVRVTLKIMNRQAVVRTTSRATVRFSGLMGQNYVAIEPGDAKGTPLTAGNEVATVDQPDISTIMVKVDEVATGIKKITDNFSDANLNDLIMPFTDFMKESRPRIMSILTNVEDITAEVRGGTGTVHQLLYENSLYASALGTVTNLNATTLDVQKMVAEARPALQTAAAALTEVKAIVSDVNAGKGTVGSLVKDKKLYDELQIAATNLREILQKINQGQGSVGKLVNDEALYRNAKLTLQKLDKVTEGLEDQGPMSVLSMAIGNLF